jgi:hypothetical protein
MLSFLRAQLRRAEKCRLVKMIVMGPPRQGKSTLLEILQTGRAPQVAHSETIRTTKWELQRPAGSRAKVKDVRRESLRGWRWGGGYLPRGTVLLSPQTAQGVLSLVCRAPQMLAGDSVCCSKAAPVKDSKSIVYMIL